MLSPVFLNEQPLRCWLQETCNRYGDFKICNNFIDKNDGEKKWTKHRSVLDCWHNNLKFLDTASHRQILPYEIVLDLDEEDSILKVEDICNHLEELEEDFYCFKTGSRGFHIHIIDKQLCQLPDKYKELIIRELYNLSDIKFDQHKASSKVMIAVCSVPHWKTGNIKTLVRKSKWLI